MYCYINTEIKDGRHKRQENDIWQKSTYDSAKDLWEKNSNIIVFIFYCSIYLCSTTISEMLRILHSHHYKNLFNVLLLSHPVCIRSLPKG